MTGKELKEKLKNLSDDENIVFGFTDSDGNIHHMRICDIKEDRFINLRDAVKALTKYCASNRSTFGMDYCKQCPFHNDLSGCVISELYNLNVDNRIPDEEIYLGSD